MKKILTPRLLIGIGLGIFLIPLTMIILNTVPQFEIDKSIGAIPSALLTLFGGGLIIIGVHKEKK